MDGTCRRIALVFLGMVWSAAGWGCSGEEMRLAEVSGRLTFNGRPAAAEIVFEPQAGGRPSSAITDATGSFRLRYTAERSGAVIGPHRVTLKVMRSNPTNEAQSFTAAVTPIKVTRLVREVSDGKNELNFAIHY